MESIDIVRRGYALYTERNFPAIFELLAENVTVWQTSALPWGGEYSGKNGAGEFFTKLAQYTAATPEPSAPRSVWGPPTANAQLRARTTMRRRSRPRQ